jgi:predicted nucleic acid-binding protein
VTTVLADTSVWIRERQPRVAEQLASTVEENRAAMTTPIALELIRGARDAADARAAERRLEALRWIPVTTSMERRAREILLRLAWRGYHRGPSPVDLLAAAAAESAGAELWHCDRHFELIGEVTGQPMRRVGE